MDTANFRYDIDFKLNSDDQKIIVLIQKPFFKGAETSIEIPVDDIDNVVKLLKYTKDDMYYLDFDELSKIKKERLDPDIVNTLATLYLSGISIRILANQYSIDEHIVKENLEEKGIILFD
jgi:hypothetical protein